MAMNPRLLRPTANDSPASIPGLALWLDASAADALYTTDAGPVEAVSSPLDISGCALWLDASRTDKMWNATSGGSLVANGEAVLRLDDISGNGKHLIQATSASAPVRQDAAVGSLAAIDFSGGKFATAGAPGDWNFLHSTQGGTVFVALRPSNVADPQTYGLILSTNGNSSSLVGVAVLFDDRVAGYNRNNYLAALITHGTSGQLTATTEQNNFFSASDAMSVATVVCSAGDAVAADRIRARRDGVLLGSNNTQTFTPSSSNSQTGLQVGGGGGEIGDIAEIIVYDTALSTSDRARVEAYLAAKWGIREVHANVVDEQAPVESPADLPDLEAWYDFSDPATYTYSQVFEPGVDRVASVLPKNGYGETLSSWIASQYQPVVGSLNGLSTLYYESTSHYQGLLQASNGSFLDPDEPLTVFVVAAPDKTQANGTCLQKESYTEPGARMYLINYYGTTNNKYRSIFRGSDGAGGALSADHSLAGVARTDSNPDVVSQVYAPGDFRFYTEQALRSTITVSPVLSTAAATPFTIGGNKAGGKYIGHLCEIVVYRRKLSDNERQRVELYLSQKWRSVDPLTPTPPVGYWKDRSGNGRHATQSTAASRPAVTTAAGKRAIVGDGGDALAITTTPSFIDGSHTLFLAMESDANVNRIPFYVGRAADVDNYPVLRGGSSVAGAFNSGIGSLAVSVATSGGLLATIRRESGVGQSLAIQGAAVASSAGGLDPSSTAIISVVGRQRASGTVSAGDIADIYEIIAYSRALSTAERRKVEVYLARRWGITLAPQVSNAEAQDWVNRVYAAGSTVSQPVANAVSAFVDGCQADGIWDAMKSVVLLAGADTLAGALAPLKGVAPTSYNFASGDYNKTSGLKGNGSSTYLNANRAGNADPQNSSHIAVYGTLLTQSDNWIGSEGASTKNAALAWYSPYLYFNLHGPNPGNQRAVTAFVASGFAGSSRTGATATAARYGGANFLDSTASSAPSAASHYVFAYNDDGVTTQHSDARLSFYSIGEAVDLALLDARVSSLMTAIGVS